MLRLSACLNPLKWNELKDWFPQILQALVEASCAPERTKENETT